MALPLLNSWTATCPAATPMLEAAKRNREGWAALDAAKAAEAATKAAADKAAAAAARAEAAAAAGAAAAGAEDEVSGALGFLAWPVAIQGAGSLPAL